MPGDPEDGELEDQYFGNVSKPGAYMVYNNQITILDALAMAGGPNEFADKTHITLMRQSERGVQALYVDMSTHRAF